MVKCGENNIIEKNVTYIEESIYIMHLFKFLLTQFSRTEQKQKIHIRIHICLPKSLCDLEIKLKLGCN